MGMSIGRYRVFALALALFVLAGCVGADGRKYVAMAEADVYALYILGAMDGCMVTGIAALASDGNQPTEDELFLLRAGCERAVRELVRVRFQNIKPPVNFGVRIDAQGRL